MSAVGGAGGGKLSFSLNEGALGTHQSNLGTSEADLLKLANDFITAVGQLDGVWKGTAFGSWGELVSAWKLAIGGPNSGGPSNGGLIGALTDIKTKVKDADGKYQQYHANQAAELSRQAAQAQQGNPYGARA